MIGDALFCSCCGDTPAWNHRFSRPHWQCAATTLPEVLAGLEAAETRARNGAWIVLALAYEAAPAFDPDLPVRTPPPGMPLFLAAAYDAPLPGPVLPAVPAHDAFAATPWRPLVERPDYDRALADIRDNIRRGEFYQVNYTIPLASRFTGDPAAWFAVLARQQGARYNAYLDCGPTRLVSFSPELFFGRQGETVTVRPMKGTMPRGCTLPDDQARAAALAACPKNRAENRMITDLLRNDLGRLARPGSVTVPTLFAVERLATAWQMTSTVTARIPTTTGLVDLLTALFPCGSITGAPKRSAMTAIRRLEARPRGFYTGAIGMIAPGGDTIMSVAIRTASLDVRTGQCRFGVGGGITYDSEAGDEYEECRIKAAFLSRPVTPFELLETLRLDHGRYSLLPEHLARLRRSADYYGFAHNPRAIHLALEVVRRAHPDSRRRVRLLLSRDGLVRTESFALGRRAPAPLRLAWASRPVAADTAGLYHKTTRRARYDQALAEHPNRDDVLLCNTRGEVTESCRANLVIARNGRLLTPALACGLLPGTLRQRLLGRGILAEAVLTPAEVLAADRLWLINSVRLWQPAVLDGRPTD